MIGKTPFSMLILRGLNFVIKPTYALYFDFFDCGVAATSW